MLWDTIINQLRDAITNQSLWFGAAGVVVLLAVLAAYNFYKPRPSETIQNQQDGWTPTGRVDFLDPRSMGHYVLQAEDTRIVDSMGGVEHRQIRWRKATLAEAKTVVVAYHAQLNLARTANLVVSSSNGHATNSDTEKKPLETTHEDPDFSKDEAPQGKPNG